MAAIAKLPWPQLVNIVIGGKTPERSNEELKKLGFAGVLYANTALQAAVLGMQRALSHLKQNGQMGNATDMLATFAERQRLVDIAVVPGDGAEIQMSARTPVLIVGGGPVGLALAGELGWRGVPCTLIEKTDGTIEQPKMDLVGIRTMEFCRRWGILDWVRDAPYPLDYPQDYVYVTGLNGYELGREPFPGRGFEPCPPESPQKRERVPQDMFDPILRRFARALAARDAALQLRTRLISAKRRTACARRCATPRPARPKPSKPTTWSAPTAAPAPCASSSASA